LFCSEVNKLAQWLQQSHTDPTLAIILVEYTLARGDKKLCDMSLRQEFHKFAYTQDLFGWDQYMLGKISKHIRPIQYRHLLESPSMLTVDDWMKQAINQLLHIVHGQWIYRNTSKHHETLGSIRRTKRMQLLLEIDRLVTLSPEDVPEESKFLLEVDFARLQTGEVTSQHYCVHAVKAAVTAGRRHTFLSRR
jgi:hypothetical protein